MKRQENCNWGDSVLVRVDAPDCLRPGLGGSICGIGTIDSIKIAMQFNQELGSEICTVEFGDGKALEIPKAFLLRL